MTTYKKFIFSLAPVVFLGGLNQYVYVFHKQTMLFFESKLWQVSAIVAASLVVVITLHRLKINGVYKSIKFSAIIFLCIIPWNATPFLVAFSFFAGTFVSLFNVRIDRCTFNLNPAISSRMIIFFLNPPIIKYDSISSATPLSLCRKSMMRMSECGVYPLKYLVFGAWPGALGETSKVGVLIGALILISFKLYNPFFLIAGIFGAVIGWFFLGVGYTFTLLPGMIDYLFMGGFLFGLVFMTQDHFTHGLRRNEMLTYHFLVGLLCFIFRGILPFPEATLISLVMSQVLFMVFFFFKRKVDSLNMD
ncbi:TPA: RnfABCDGE type electron transport complex subunit D [Serratia marcescens]